MGATRSPWSTRASRIPVCATADGLRPTTRQGSRNLKAEFRSQWCGGIRKPIDGYHPAGAGAQPWESTPVLRRRRRRVASQRLLPREVHLPKGRVQSVVGSPGVVGREWRGRCPTAAAGGMAPCDDPCLPGVPANPLPDEMYSLSDTPHLLSQCPANQKGNSVVPVFVPHPDDVRYFVGFDIVCLRRLA
jgi:hypothetical protein